MERGKKKKMKSHESNKQAAAAAPPGLDISFFCSTPARLLPPAGRAQGVCAEKRGREQREGFGPTTHSEEEQTLLSYIDLACPLIKSQCLSCVQILQLSILRHRQCRFSTVNI